MSVVIVFSGCGAQNIIQVQEVVPDPHAHQDDSGCHTGLQQGEDNPEEYPDRTRSVNIGRFVQRHGNGSDKARLLEDRCPGIRASAEHQQTPGGIHKSQHAQRFDNGHQRDHRRNHDADQGAAVQVPFNQSRTPGCIR